MYRFQRYFYRRLQMSQVGKFIVTEDGLVDLGQFLWDDDLFAESLQKDLPVELKQALDISQSVRNQVFSADIDNPAIVNRQCQRTYLAGLFLPKHF